MSTWLKERTIFLAKTGSRAYGIHQEDSDVDIHGICIPPKEYFLGFANRIEQFDKPSHMQQFIDLLNAEEQEAVKRTKIEGTIFGIHKFFSLAKDCNPNLIQLLFSDDSSVLFCNDIGKKLIKNRHLFISKVAKFRFSGYAISQLKKIQLHRGYLLNPKEEKPLRSNFGLPELIEINPSQFSMVKAEIDKQMDQWSEGYLGDVEESTKIRIRESIAGLLSELKISEENRIQLACNRLGFDSNFTEYFQKENAFNRAVKEWQSYQNWKVTRNPARSALEAKYGYDLKHATHLIRLLKMAIEILRDGEVNVMREDALELLQIRQGDWQFDRLISYAKELEEACNEAYKSSKLPHHSNIKLIDDLCIELVEEGIATL